MHHLYRPILVSPLPDEVWPEQNSQASSTENFLRVVAVNCNELTVESDVFEGKLKSGSPPPIAIN